MAQKIASPISRRRFLKTAGVTALAAGAGPVIIIPGRAQPKTLKILRPKSFVSAFNPWFEEYAKAWGEKRDINVIVDFVPYNEIYNAFKTDAMASQKHDLLEVDETVALYEDQVIDHREIHEECEHRYGKANLFVRASTYNPKTKKFFAFF